MMSVDLDSSDTFLVADTSVLIRSLPMVRAVIESSQPYTVYVPYVVLTELDKGRTAAPVNRLLCRYMKQKHPRIIAQGVQGHKEVTQASGITPKNDDLILGAALKLKEEGLQATMLTNDNNLGAKCCANGLSTWSSLDFMCKVKDAVPEMDRFITKDLKELSPHAPQLFTFCTDLFMCALKFRMAEQDQLTSINNGVVYRLVDRAKEKKIVNDSELLDRCVALIRECRKKGRNLAYESVQRLLRYVCAILEFLKSDDTVARILNVCKGIFSGLKNHPKAKSTTQANTLTSSIVENKSKKRLENMSGAQKKQLVQIVTKVDTNRRKSDGIKKNTSRRKILLKVGSFESDDEMETDDDSAEEAMKAPETTSTSRSVSDRLHPASANPSTTAMEIEVIANRPQQTFGPLVGDDVRSHPVYRMLETVWTSLHNISGTWASRCGVDYAWKPDLQKDFEAKLTTLADFAVSLGRIEEDYSRLLKLGSSVSPDLMLTVATRFIETLREVGAESLGATPGEVVQFFQDERTSDILLQGRNQLQAFREAIVQCRSQETQKVFDRLDKQKRCL